MKNYKHIIKERFQDGTGYDVFDTEKDLLLHIIRKSGKDDVSYHGTTTELFHFLVSEGLYPGKE